MLSFLGITLHVEAAKDVPSGTFYPAWLVQEGSEWKEKADPWKSSSKSTPHTDINMKLAKVTFDFNFAYKSFLGESHERKVVFTYWTATCPPNVLTKWKPLKRPAFKGTDIVTPPIVV